MFRGRRQNSGWLGLPNKGTEDPVVKPAPYLPIYEELLAPLRNSAFTLLELGVWGGDSLEMWRDSFKRATVVGVDLFPPEVQLGPRVHVIRGDQADATLMQRIRDDYAPGGFDIIIDDGSHIGVTTARSLQALYADHLRPGGLYCIEDWGTGYLPDWQDGGSLQTSLDVMHLDGVADFEHETADSTEMPSHCLGMVGLVKRLIDHAASGTLSFAQPDAVGETLAIESMRVWDGIVALKKADV
jgi:SAM-dependent methyltransferase